METKKIPSIDVKCRFFAQHWGQNVLMNNRLTLMGKHLISDDLDKYWLNLKPLSKISDEDALNLVKIFADAIDFTENQIKHFKEDIIAVYENKINDFMSSSSLRTIFTGLDYLRKKGYAIPFDEYSVEDLISFGWLKLT